MLNYFGCANNRVKTQRNLELLTMFASIQLHPQGTETLLMGKQLVCVLDALFTMILRQEKKIHQRMVYVVTSSVTQSLETKSR